MSSRERYAFKKQVGFFSMHGNVVVVEVVVVVVFTKNARKAEPIF